MLELGGWIFWTFITVIIVALTYTVETKGKGELGWPFIWLAVGIATYIYFFQREAFWPWVKALDWFTVIMYVGGYLLIGIFLAVLQMESICKKTKSKL